MLNLILPIILDMKFDVITMKKAEVSLHGQSYSSDTWFPGMRWTLASCKSCHTHLGWYFSAPPPSNKQNFYGLILDRLVSKDCKSLNCQLIDNNVTF